MDSRPSPLSKPFATLTANRKPRDIIQQVDVLIIGSGYGGSVAAYRMAHPERKVLILERGREYQPGEFPENLGQLPKFIRWDSWQKSQPVGYNDALFDIRHGEGMDVLVGSGVGGTSLINANVAAEPPDQCFNDPVWPQHYRNRPDRLKSALSQVSKCLDVGRIPSEQITTRKYRALGNLANALGKEHQVSLSDAPLTVSFSTDPETLPKNHFGIPRPACTHCGNCVTGCNVGAKNTLASNLLPMARERGASIVHGATCLTVEPLAGEPENQELEPPLRWRAAVSPTNSTDPEEIYLIDATTVILSAGTLGSTQILMQSASQGHLQLSAQLGKRFSGNGDGLAFGFAQANPVDAIGTSDSQHPGSRIGPTINGMLSVQTNNGTPLLIEDGAIPFSLSKIFGEIISQGAWFHRIGDRRLPALFNKDGSMDPLAASATALSHSQTILVMGDDHAAGEIRARDTDAPVGKQRVFPYWPQQTGNAALRQADQLLASQSFKDGFDGGQYVPNLIWRLLPDSAGSVISGPLPGERNISVHPLGGCAMGDSAASGVVSWSGEVFRHNSDNGSDPELSSAAIYQGLFVLDGSILPRALGVNPFLTIAALSWEACSSILQQNKWQECQLDQIRTIDTPLPLHLPLTALPTSGYGNLPSQRQMHRLLQQKPTRIRLREQLIGQLEGAALQLGWLRARLSHEHLRRLCEYRGLILNLEAEVNLTAWLENPAQATIRVIGSLHVNPLSAEDARLVKRMRVHDLNDETKLARLEGEVALLAPDQPGSLRRIWRGAKALLAYHQRRDNLLKALQSQLNQGATTFRRGQIRDHWRSLRGFINVALMHAAYRRMHYQLQDNELTLEGTKVLAFSPGHRSLWNSLFDLPVKLSHLNRPGSAKGLVRVNSLAMLDELLPQIETMENGPEMVADLLRFTGLTSRALLQTHFWSFGAPNCAPLRPRPKLNPDKIIAASGKLIAPLHFQVNTRLRKDSKLTVQLSLARYPQSDGLTGAPSILLLHGLAQGSRIFSTESLRTNMAAYFHQQGYDVWLADYRLSNLILPQIQDRDWAIDEIAEYDIPALITEVNRLAGTRPHVFAHCVGSTAMFMALLSGWVSREQIASLSVNAIHPWVIPSPTNRIKSLLGTALRDHLSDDFLNPVPDRNDSVARHLLDRAAHSLARLDECSHRQHASSSKNHMDQTVCDRMTFLYGRMWRHQNLADATHRALPELVGEAPGEVYRHLFHFTERFRITDRKGCNSYLTAKNIQKLSGLKLQFIHGECSEVFNPHSATVSANRLRQLLPDTQIEVNRIPEFGHMDIIFAKNASERVYPAVLNFIENKPAEPASPVTSDSTLNPLATWLPETGYGKVLGPVLRGARKEGDQLILRYWIEVTDISLYPEAEVVALNQGQRYTPLQILSNNRYKRLLFDIVWQQGPVLFIRSSVIDGNQLQEVLASTEPTSCAWIHRQLGQTRDSFGFLVGSCRYPGTPMERDFSDRIFGRISALIAQDEPIDRIFMIGDQIYADATANILPPSPRGEHYADAYRQAFSSSEFLALCQTAPVHFAVDDHEFSDNWSGASAQCREGQQTLYRNALGMAKYYLGDHRHPGSQNGASLWYSLNESECSFPVFICDTRSERDFRSADSQAKHHILGKQQLESLCSWLISHAQSPGPKLIFSGSVMAPIPIRLSQHPETFREQDNWLGYPDTMAVLLDTITRYQIRGVIFIGGDLHFSALSRLTMNASGRKPIEAWHITSSGLYAPLPFTQSPVTDFDWNTVSNYEIPGYIGYGLTSESILLNTQPQQFLGVFIKMQQVQPASAQLELTGHVPTGIHPVESDTLPDWATLNRDRRKLTVKIQ